jgi:hypothetical protein
MENDGKQPETLLRNKMIIMPSNNTGRVVKELFKKYPDKLALLMNPHCIRPGQFSYRYAIDNAAFSQFREDLYFKLLDTSQKYSKPIFCVSPDVVGCHDRSLALWHYYYPRLKEYGFPIAFVAQNGCEPKLVPKNADWVFVGGLDPWKQENIHKYAAMNIPCHVGRVNGIGRLKYCESLGVDSIDGTGWMRARDKKFYDLMDYFGREKQLGLFTK